ncbi:MAG: UDPglucose 6-dehydrogenase [Acidimicrobiia bacterium]|jgi:UDPglucose 6-dehydrogenase|nr:UDPglucose 6-dehydrogenase [Acidimicrobiia bacterium]
MARAIVVGSGVVGTATGKGLLRMGHAVTFVDLSPSRLRALRGEGLAATNVVNLAGPPAYVFLCLPTPNVGDAYDLKAFTVGVETVGRALRDSSAFHTIVVRSTVPPGTCDQLVTPVLQSQSGKVAGEHFAVASNPEFLRAACALEDVLNPWMTVIGSRSKRTIERLTELLKPYGGEFRTFGTPVEAELVKCAHNLFNAAKISFWNEIWLVARELKVTNMDQIAATVARSAEGSINIEYGIKAGMPFGGVCLPKDTRGFLGFARELGVHMPLLEGVVRVNEAAEEATLEELSDMLDTHPALEDGRAPETSNGSSPTPA